MKKGRQRLQLNRETLRVVATRELAAVGGGGWNDQYGPLPKTNAWGLHAAGICVAVA